MVKHISPTEFVAAWEQRIETKRQQHIPYTATVTSVIGSNSYRIQRPEEDTPQTINTPSIDDFVYAVGDRVVVLPLDDEVDVIIGRFVATPTGRILRGGSVSGLQIRSSSVDAFQITDSDTGGTLWLDADSVGHTLRLYDSGLLRIYNQGSSQYTVNITGGTTSGGIIQIWDNAHVETCYMDGTTGQIFGYGNAVFGDGNDNEHTFWGHHLMAGSAPVSTIGTAAGTGAVVSSTVGSDAAFRVSIVTGTSPTVGTLFTVTFADSWTNNEYQIAFNAGDSDAAVDVGSVYADYLSRSTTAFDFKSRVALSASRTYIYFFQVTGAL